MGTRLQLDDILKSISPNVYYQKPSDNMMKYPCIVYTKDDFDMKYAGNLLYIGTNRYRIKIIGYAPDSTLVADIIKLPLCSFVTKYKVNNLNHEIYNLYY